jgi:hypothetical protein
MGMGMGGWGGAAAMSPWMGGAGGMNMGGSMSPVGAVSSPNPTVGAATTGGYGGQGMRNQSSQEPSSNQAGRGRNLQAPTSAGLPIRPNTQAGQSPNAGSGGGRDYSREKSPERGSNNSSGGRGGSGGYNRDSRW